GGEIELHQCVNRLGGRVHDVQKTLVGPNLELLTRLLIDMGRAVHGKLVDSRRQRNWAANLRAGTLGRRDDLARGRVENAMVKRLKANANILTVHLVNPAENGSRRAIRAPRMSYGLTSG